MNNCKKSKIVYKIRKSIVSVILKSINKVSPELLIRILYYRFLKKRLNLKNPIDLNEKINYLKLNSDTTVWSRLADKYEVRDYICQKGLEDILVPMYGVYDDTKDLDFDILPEQFVIKPTNGSGDVIIVRDKQSIDRVDVTKTLDKELKKRYGLIQGEPHYLKIKPRLVVEKLLNQDEVPGIVTCSLIDYKIFCFNGVPECIMVFYNRSKHKVQISLFDTEWNNISKDNLIYDTHYQKGDDLPIPTNLSRLLECASILSSGFPQCRVDLYSIAGKVYFGEITFTSQGGYMPYFTVSALKRMGDKVTL